MSPEAVRATHAATVEHAAEQLRFGDRISQRHLRDRRVALGIPTEIKKADYKSAIHKTLRLGKAFASTSFENLHYSPRSFPGSASQNASGDPARREMATFSA